MKTPNAGRACRGGSWFASPKYCHTAFRNFIVAPSRGDLMSFRIARRKR